MDPVDKKELAQRLRTIQTKFQQGTGHYSHWDKAGTAGANCPACMHARDAHSELRALITELEPLE